MSGESALVVPYDFSEHAKAALGTARDLALKLRADLHLLHVLPAAVSAIGGYDGLPLTDREALRMGVERSLLDVAAAVDNGPRSVAARVLEGADIVDGICQVAKELGADLIVMGTHGRTGLAHALLGSVTERTLRQAPCPVLTVRAQPAVGA